MAGPRLVYLCALLGCGVFYIAYGEWFSWILLLSVLTFPWVSLALSIPAILRFRAIPEGPDHLFMGGSGTLWLLGNCPAPMPPFQGILQLQSSFTGETRRYNADKGIPADHCGSFRITVEKGRIYDYLGLFSFPIRKGAEKVLRIYPSPLPLENIPNLPHFLAPFWKPKAGGGFSENHELRSYRPGDPLNQIHWKLSAKSGNLILREAMEPLRGKIILTMTLRGTAVELDRKLGRLFWLGKRIIHQNIPFEIRVLTGTGLLSFCISEISALHQALDTLLCTPVTAVGSLRDQNFGAVWQYHVGGNPDE